MEMRVLALENVTEINIYFINEMVEAVFNARAIYSYSFHGEQNYICIFLKLFFFLVKIIIHCNNFKTGS